MDERHDQLSEADQRVVAMAEAEIRRTLSAEPSPEFQAKVRIRIAAEPLRTRPWFMRWEAGVAFATIAIVIASFSLLRGPGLSGPATVPVASRSAVEPATGGSAQTEQPRAATQPPDVAPPAPERRRQPVRYRAATAAAHAEAVTAEVLIDPAQQAAVKRLFAMTQRGVKLPEGGDKGIVVPGELLVASVVVPPLEVPSIEIGAVDKIGSR